MPGCFSQKKYRYACDLLDLHADFCRHSGHVFSGKQTSLLGSEGDRDPTTRLWKLAFQAKHIPCPLKAPLGLCLDCKGLALHISATAYSISLVEKQCRVNTDKLCLLFSDLGSAGFAHCLNNLIPFLNFLLPLRFLPSACTLSVPWHKNHKEKR